MGFCIIKPNKHQLWDEIAEVVGSENRELIKYWYNVAHDNRFLEASANDIVLNEEGEPTFSSLLKAANTTEYNEKIKETLNKKIGAGEMTYKEACEKLFNFNKNSNYNDKYLATIQRTEGGKVRLFITERTNKTTKDLYKQLKNGSIAERLQAKLNEYGVTYEFLENTQFEGRYSTMNSEKVLNGLNALISIRDGNIVDETLAEEAGHFVIGSLRNSALVKRLENALNTDVIKDIFGEELENKDFGAQPRREVAGYLVGQALLNRLNHNSVWNKLANRIAYISKKIFAKITRNDTLKLKNEAINIANQLAKSFLNDAEFEGTIEEALETKETFYQADKHAVERTFEGVRNTLMKLRDVLSVYDKEAAAAVSGIINDVAKDYSNIDMVMRQQATNGLFMFIDGLMGQIIPIRKQMAVVRQHMESNSDYWNNFVQDGKTLRQYRDTVKAVVECVDIINKYVQTLSPESKDYNQRTAFMDEGGGVLKETTQYLKDVAFELQNLIKGENSNLEKEMFDLTKGFYCKFLESVYGRSFIHVGQQRIFKSGRQVVVAEHDVKISELLDAISEDGSTLGRFLGAMYNSSDAINQIVFKAYKAAETEAAVRTISLHDQLRALKKRANSSNMSNSEFYEVDENGHYTGNFLDLYNYGKYEREYNEMKLEFKKKFAEKYKDYYDERDLAIKFSTEFAEARHEFLKKTHNQKELPGGKIVWVLKDEYVNKEYLRKFGYNESYDYDDLYTQIFNKGSEGTLSEKEQLLFDIKKLKRELDRELPQGSTVSNRAPQFKTSLFHRLGNAFIGNDNIAIKGKNAILAGLNACGATFVMNATEGDFGSDMHNTDDDFQIVKNPYYDDYMRLDRLPLYGIKKVQKYTQFSTDIWNGLAMYGNMAYKYAAKDKIINVLELGKSVLGKRKIGGYEQSIIDGAKLLAKDGGRYKKESINPKLNYLEETRVEGTGLSTEDTLNSVETPNYYKRYLAFLDKQMYQHPYMKKSLRNVVRINKQNWLTAAFGGGSKTIQNVLHSANKITGIVALGGNLGVAAVSLADGLVEIIKEAGAHENFTQASLLEALTIFARMNIGNTAASVGLSIPILNAASNTKFNGSDLHLLNRFWEIATTAEDEAKKWNTQNLPSIDALAMKMLYSGMSAGTLAMNMIPAIAMLRTNYIYTKYGEKISLFRWSMKYAKQNETTSIVDKNFKAASMSMPKGNFFRNAEDADKYGILQIAKKNLDNFIESEDETVRDVIFDGTQLDLIRKESGDFLRKLDIQEDPNGYYTVNLTKDQAKEFLKHTEFTMDKLTWGVKDMAQFKAYMRSVLNNMHGMYDFDSSNAAQQTILGGLWAHMKGYVFGLVRRRFATSSYNMYAKSDDGFGGIVEGSLVTAFKGLTSIFYSRRTFLKFMLATFLGAADVAGGGLINSALNRMDFVDKDYLQELGTNILIKEGFCQQAYANIKRTIGDYALALLLNAAFGYFSQPPEDDPYYDLTYNNPWEFINRGAINNKFAAFRPVIEEACQAYRENRLPKYELFGRTYFRMTDILMYKFDENGGSPELCTDKELLERFGTRQNVDKLKKIRTNELRGINRYYDARPVDTRACIRYILGRVANDNSAFNDIFFLTNKESATKRELKGLANFGMEMIAPAMVSQLGEIFYMYARTYGWMGQDNKWMHSVKTFDEHIHSFIKDNYMTNVPSKRTVVENLLTMYKKDPNWVNNSIFKDDTEILDYMLDNNLSELSDLDNLFKDTFYSKNNYPYKRYDAKVDRYIQKITPFIRSIQTAYNAKESFDSFMFASRK